MPSIGERIEAVRERRPAVDHTVRMVQHFGVVNGSQQAGAITYFGFLSFFPVLAIAFFAVSIVARVYPGARSDLQDALESLLPGLVGGDSGIRFDDVQTFSGLAAIVAFAGVLYAGLGWLSALRAGLEVVFEQPVLERPNFVKGKAIDLLTLGVIGAILLVSVAISGAVTRFSSALLDLVGLGTELAPVLTLLSLALGLAANVLLFFAMFTLLGRAETPRRSLLSGALLGAVVFEVLKQLSSLLLASTKSQPAFQAFGIALVLLVWINYFSRVVLYAAAWAHTSPEARAARDTGPAARVHGPSVGGLAGPAVVGPGGALEPAAASGSAARRWVAPFAAGGAAMLALVAAVRRRSP